MLKAFARGVVFPFLTATGLDRVFSSLTKKRHLLIMYHGVVRKMDPGLSVNHLSLEDFEEHVRYIKKNFEVVPVHELFRRKQQGGRSHRKTIAITFDDGYENNYLNAFPVLKKYNLPATIFVVAEAVRDPAYVLWYDR